jgi:thymidylate kinase
MRVITISGLDGSGKSTQVERLSKRLADEGKRVHYFHSVHFSVAEKLSRRSKSRGPAGSERAEKPGVTSASGPSIALRKLFLRVDLVRYRRLLRRLEAEGYDAVLSDRYFYDNVVNIAYLSRTTRLLAVRIPQPTHRFYLRVQPAAIMSRGRAPEQGIAYLEAKLTLYDALAARDGLVVVDGSATEAAVAADILKRVNG